MAAAGRLIWPLIEPVLNATGQVVAGAVLTVYKNLTTTLVTVYADAGLTTPVSNPQAGIYASNAAGRFFTQTHAFWVPAGSLYTLRIDRPDGTFDVVDNIQPQGGEISVAALPAGAMTIPNGQLQLSNASASPTTQISVSVGGCRDALNAVQLTLATAMTKRIDQAWSAGNGGGLRLSGALGANQTWFVFLMQKPDGTSDIGADGSPTAPALPAGYTYLRRLGAILTDGTNALRPFVQFDNLFKLGIRSTDYASQVNSGAPFYRAVTVPKGIKVTGHFYFQTVGTADTNNYLSGIFDPDFGVPPAYGTSTQWAQIRRSGYKDVNSNNVSGQTTIVRQETDANASIYTFSSDPAELMALGVVAWEDHR